MSNKSVKMRSSFYTSEAVMSVLFIKNVSPDDSYPLLLLAKEDEIVTQLSIRSQELILQCQINTSIIPSFIIKWDVGMSEICVIRWLIFGSTAENP